MNETLHHISFKKYFLFLSAFFLVFVVRFPEALIHGRFWAEEGSIFYQNAATLSFWKALFFSYGGYLNFPANVAGILAYHCFSLRLAPYFTSFYGVLFQLFPVIIIFSAKEIWLDDWKKKIFAAFLVTMVPASAEISFQSLHGQIWLDLCCALIICTHPISGKGQYFRYFFLALAPLSGLGALLFIPFLGLKLLLEKTKERLIGFLLISFFGSIQFFLFRVPFPGRDTHHSLWEMLGIFWAREPIELLSGYFKIIHFHSALKPFLILDFSAVLSILLIISIVFIAVKQKKYLILWLLAINLVFTFASIFNSLSCSTTFFLCYPNGGRYFFLGQGLFCLTIFYLSIECKNKVRDFFRFLAFAFAINSFLFYLPVPGLLEDRSFLDGPSWKNEIQKYEHDICYPIRIWPGSKDSDGLSWHLFLPQGKECLAPPRDQGAIW